MRVAVSVVLFHPDRASLDVPFVHLRGWPLGPVHVLVNEDDGTTSDWARAALPDADVRGSEVNLGFAGGQNSLIAQAFAAGADAVVVHNPDLVLDPNAVAPMLAAAAEHGALVGPVLELADPRTTEGEGRADTLGIRWTRGGRHLDAGQGGPLPDRGTPPYRVAGVSGACLLVTRPVYERVVQACDEFFDEDFLAFREDAELGFRAALLGVPCFVVPAARGRHARGNRGTSRGRSAHVDRLGVRNRFLIAFKYGRHRPGGVLGPLVRDLVVMAGVLLRERSSWPGVVEAWHLRRRMREKGRKVLEQAIVSSRTATRPPL